jgi:8-oxo-dGTP pyrophosphatase MutT (NUDIX family)
MAVTPRDAATVMLVRDAQDVGSGAAVEVCMLRRNLSSEFVAGAYVFPGGALDPGDRSSEATALCRGMSDDDASVLLGLDTGGLAFWVAALRECFEESGVLVGRHDDGPRAGELLDTSDPETAARFEKHRRGLLEGETTLPDICREDGLVLAVDEMHYVSHWITPEVSPRRYDTRFFITAAPPGQTARHDAGETIATVWVRPHEALERHAALETVLLPPTVANLKSIADCTSTEEAMAWASGVTHVETILPIVLFEDGNLVILRPGDSGYEEARADLDASGAVLDPDLGEAARTVWGPQLGIV